ncbi:MAG: hypothetical protein AUJ97_03675 [Bacteroidetes bacterium CG2_30_32_10]|nr:MAG: hypothetical protein AUJ97_03675 [Bacteroidetes bacterium CG2_30_32_10]
MNEEQHSIWDYLVANAQGMNNAKHIGDIAEAIGQQPYGTNNDNVRIWIKDMVLNHSSQIGTCHNGAFIILTDSEREEAALFLERNYVADAVRRNGNYIP